jgi:hypothetical protein
MSRAGALDADDGSHLAAVALVKAAGASSSRRLRKTSFLGSQPFAENISYQIIGGWNE